ncbi:MAG: Shedu immune nuclease family protein [Pseudorhodoplanes sp.]
MIAMDDVDYIANSKTDALYTYPAKNGNGAYAKLVGDSEEVLGEIDVTSRCKLAISAFYVQERADFDTFKITKLKFHKTRGWVEDGHVHVNHFQIGQMKEFLSIISSLDLRDAKKTRISLDNIHIGALGALLTSNKGAALIQELAASPELHHDIYAVGAKRRALTEFESGLGANLPELEWQKFFERNPWIFGHGLNYVFLNKVGKRLEAQTTGSTFDRAGKRADGLLLTRAEVSQYVLVEIKKNDTDLLQDSAYRSGCWSVSSELSDAVTQIQKTVFEFGRTRFHDRLKDEFGNDTGNSVYSIEPRSFLVIGNLAQLKTNDDKVACFELYRRNIRAPEILTFDELFQRAGCIVENISRESEGVGKNDGDSFSNNANGAIPF